MSEDHPLFARLQTGLSATPKAPPAQNAQLPRASILVALTQTPEPEIILTRRAAHLSSHPGQVAFPGGKQDPKDDGPVHTALRESQEEIGLDPEHVTVMGSLSPLISRNGLWVTPICAQVPEQLELIANEGETDAIFHVPIDFLADTPPARFDHIIHERSGQTHEWYVPAWFWQDLEIWGLSSMVLCELLGLCTGRQFDMTQRQAGFEVLTHST